MWIIESEYVRISVVGSGSVSGQSLLSLCIKIVQGRGGTDVLLCVTCTVVECFVMLDF